jgi:hypothetical protein
MERLNPSAGIESATLEIDPTYEKRTDEGERSPERQQKLLERPAARIRHSVQSLA